MCAVTILVCSLPSVCFENRTTYRKRELDMQYVSLVSTTYVNFSLRIICQLRSCCEQKRVSVCIKIVRYCCPILSKI
jgi:hypothetical protein